MISYGIKMKKHCVKDSHLYLKTEKIAKTLGQDHTMFKARKY